MRRNLTIITVAASFCVCGAVASVPAQSRVTTKDGVKHILNPSVAREQQVVSTRELWRRGGEEDEVVFGTIGDFACDRAGKTYVLDIQRNEIHVMEPDGRYAKTIGREGEGPGEFRMASGLALLSDDVVCVTQAVPARAVRMTLSGRAMSDHPLAPELVATFINGCDVVGGRLAVCSGETVQEKASIGFRTRFGVLDTGGKMTIAQWELFQSADVAKMVFDEKADAEPVWAFTPDGHFLVNDDWDLYAVEVIDAKGRVVHVLERDYQHRPRTKAELGAIEARKKAGEIPSETKVSSTSRDVVRMVPRPDGRMWVLSSRGDMDPPAGTIAIFDEFDSAGKLLKTVSVRGVRRPQTDSFYIADDLVFVVTNGADGSPASGEDAGAGELEIICLRMTGMR